jgi:prepilin-type N-terminal cleavage/methylation domain-containing protein
MGNKTTHSFTLMELLVVMAMISILALIAYPAYVSIEERAKGTKDMNNLRQIGIATQMYMNDNDGTLPGSTTATWMSQLQPKYVATWGIFQSPFDTRAPSELGDATTPVSYGINANSFPNNTAISADKIAKSVIFILFAPAQDNSGTVVFQGTAATLPHGVTVLGAGSNTATSNPGGNATGGTQNSRTRINALFADLHCETMSWTTFTSNTANPPSDPDGNFRWTPYTPYP